MFKPIKDRVKFLDYNQIVKVYENITLMNKYSW